MRYITIFCITMLLCVGVLFLMPKGEVNIINDFSDEVLIKNLDANKAKFEELILMMRMDRSVVIRKSSNVPETLSINESRWLIYQQLFSELALDGGVRSGQRGSILLISHASGLVTGSTTKGYIYNPDGPQPQFDNLNHVPAALASNQMGFKKIDADWYLFLIWDD